MKASFEKYTNGEICIKFHWIDKLGFIVREHSFDLRPEQIQMLADFMKKIGTEELIEKEEYNLG